MALASKYDHFFKQELKNLNPAQKEAVETIDGPVLVIAGPGTGKTQILSARVGEILSRPETQANPHNILCLTYTDAGTIAMRKRLLKFIGPDAYRVHIFTFHAFCNQVIQENLDYFGFRDLQPLSELEEISLYKKLIDSFDAKHPLKRFKGDVYYEAGRLKPLFDVMKKENWSVEFITGKVKEYLEDLPNREEFVYKRATKGFKAGDVKEDSIKAEKEKLDLLLAAAGEFENYTRLMLEMKRYDYNDMILWVLKAFRGNPSMLLQYQERYLYFMVDEYQDTNGAQNEILSLLTSYWDVPNVFAVGDDDQSIYRFQGANVKNIIDFHGQFAEHLKLIVMKNNYRSSQNILNVSKAVIDNNEERLVKKIQGLDKNLSAQGALADNKQPPVLTEYFNVIHEEAAIVEKLSTLHSQGEDLSEVAVIYRNHRMVENIVKALEAKNIPLNIKQKINILALPLIQNIITLLTYIESEYRNPDSAEHLLFEIMHYDFFNISSRDAAVLARHCYDKKEKYRVVMASKERLLQLNLHQSKSISELEGNLAYWTKELPNMTVQGLFEKILTKGGLLTYVMNSPDKIWLMQVLTTFFDFIKEESSRATKFQLKDLLRMLEQMIAHNIPLNLNKVVHSEKGINFITAHSSKGLEFKTVYLIGALSKYWEGQKSRSNTYKFPDTLTETNVDGNRAEDERRLFYVALTRAKENLLISWPASDNTGKQQEMSRFVAEILDKETMPVQQVSLPDDQILAFQATLMINEEKPSVKLIDEEYLKKTLENYKMSVTHLNKYLKCPLSFYFENLIRVPTARNESMGFGQAVHTALYLLFKQMVDSQKKEFPDADTFYQLFVSGMNNYHSHFTEEQFERRLQYGAELLPELYKTYVSKWHKIVSLEYRIANVEVEGVPVTGVLDKVEFDGFKVNVVDYKTGKPSNGKKKLVPPGEQEPLGGDYWRQIVFYKILLDSDKRRNYEMLSGEIDFIEPDDKGNFVKEKIYVKPEDIKLVKSQITETYKKIMAFEFSEGCGKEDCQWCNFVKYNYKSEDLILPEEEIEG